MSKFSHNNSALFNLQEWKNTMGNISYIISKQGNILGFWPTTVTPTLYMKSNISNISNIILRRERLYICVLTKVCVLYIFYTAHCAEIKKSISFIIITLYYKICYLCYLCYLFIYLQAWQRVVRTHFFVQKCYLHVTYVTFLGLREVNFSLNVGSCRADQCAAQRAAQRAAPVQRANLQKKGEIDKYEPKKRVLFSSFALKRRQMFCFACV